LIPILRRFRIISH
jgi:hypothetical protein